MIIAYMHPPPFFETLMNYSRRIWSFDIVQGNLIKFLFVDLDLNLSMRLAFKNKHLLFSLSQLCLTILVFVCFIQPDG